MGPASAVDPSGSRHFVADGVCAGTAVGVDAAAAAAGVDPAAAVDREDGAGDGAVAAAVDYVDLRRTSL